MLASEQTKQVKQGDHASSTKRENYTGEKQKQLRHGKPKFFPSINFFARYTFMQSICMIVPTPCNYDSVYEADANPVTQGGQSLAGSKGSSSITVLHMASWFHVTLAIVTHSNWWAGSVRCLTVPTYATHPP